MLPARGLHGGIRLDAHQERSTSTPIQILAAPAIAILPLDQHSGVPARSIVGLGERVLKGQPIAAPAGEISAWLHAPVSGRVIAIEERPATTRAGGNAACIVLENDGREDRFDHPRVSQFSDFNALAPAELLDRITHGGIVGLGGAAFPTAAKLVRANETKIRTVLLNGVECEPHISCDEMLMRERAADIVLGAQLLVRALDASRCIIALEASSTVSESALRSAVDAIDRSIQIVVVPDIYPAGGERQLIAAVCGEEVPFAGLPADIGVVCQNVGTAAAIAKWIRDAEPLISRVVTVTGDGIQQPRNVEARIGTPIRELIEQCGGYTPRMQQLLMGGTMMGIALPEDSLPIIKATNCIIAASAADLQPRAQEMPCIRCGNCSEVCPANLLPQQLHLNAVAVDLAGLDRYGLLDCIECGCCDYVCPSQIPLVERFRRAKPLLMEQLASKTEARDARLRFEARTTRLERLESEQRHKMEEKRRQARANPT
jgi:electron transport complex protein RnfC